MIDKTQFFINGVWVKPFQPNELEVINPSNEDVCAKMDGCFTQNTTRASA